MFAPYKVATWADIPDANKEADRPLDQQLHRLHVDRLRRASSATSPRSPTSPIPSTRARSPSTATRSRRRAGFNGVVLAALANGGSADNIAPGVDFFKKLADTGNLLPVDPTPATIASGQTPIVIDWTYNNGAQIAGAQAEGHRLEGRRPVATRRPSPRSTTTRSTRTPPHPAAARCWMEYIFSDAGQNTWLKGFALPVRLRRCRRPGRSTQAALAAVNPPTTAAGPC